MSKNGASILVVLMQDIEVKRLLIEPPASLVLIRLPTHASPVPQTHLGARLFSWLRRLRERQETIWQREDRQIIRSSGTLLLPPLWH